MHVFDEIRAAKPNHVIDNSISSLIFSALEDGLDMFEAIKRSPGIVISPHQLFPAHLGVVHTGLRRVVFVQVFIHRDPLQDILLMVLGSGKRRHNEELCKLQRQFPF